MITNLTETKTKPHVDSVTTLYSMQMLHQRTELTQENSVTFFFSIGHQVVTNFGNMFVFQICKKIYIIGTSGCVFLK